MSIDWSLLYHGRKETSAKLGDIWDLPIEKRYHQPMLKHCKKGDRVLEIGAGGRELKAVFEKQWGEVDYKSMDIDANRFHDYYALSDIEGTYDLVCMFEIIEHVQPEEAYEILQAAYKHLAPGGSLVVSTPNIFHPPAFLRDATHITPWCYDELGGIAKLAGFDVTMIYRLYHDSLIKKLFRRYLGYPIFRLIGIDFAKQILLVAGKPLG